ncbi:hypothetical protein TNCV_206101 [Trichonephila clavipes]|nr:hypothetical protein TNCV_206101 [Trichonephila clavipes]
MGYCILLRELRSIQSCHAEKQISSRLLNGSDVTNHFHHSDLQVETQLFLDNFWHSFSLTCGRDALDRKEGQPFVRKKYQEMYSQCQSDRLIYIPSIWLTSCQVIYDQFGLAILQNDHQTRRRFVEWAQNEIAVVPDFHKRILFSDAAHFWLNGYVNKQNCRIWSEANPQVYVETPLHPEKLTVWCASWAGGILLQKR